MNMGTMFQRPQPCKALVGEARLRQNANLNRLPEPS